MLKKIRREVSKDGKRDPRNVRQIGNISGGPKIYVEDYVDTFFGQISDQTEEIRGAFLIGEMEDKEHPDYIYITGAIQMYELKRDGNTFQITEETWKMHTKTASVILEMQRS